MLVIKITTTGLLKLPATCGILEVPASYIGVPFCVACISTKKSV